MYEIQVGKSIRSFEQLEQGLRNWCNIGDTPAYDAAGMMALFCACLENLRSNLPEDILAEDYGSTLTESEVAILKILLSRNEFA